MQFFFPLEDEAFNQKLDSICPISYNLFAAFGPGIYQIYCKANNKRYIGESENVLDRLAKHTRNLKKGVSECYELQKDWNTYDPTYFEAIVLHIGPEWKSREVRLKKERELICSYLPKDIYNQHPDFLKKTEDNYAVVCEINGTRFLSIGEASRITRESETRIRTKLYTNVPGYVIIDKNKNGYEPIIANGKEYTSIMAAVTAGEAKDRFEAMRKLKNIKKRDWNYVSPKLDKK